MSILGCVKDWVGQVFHSNFHSKSRGAAILVDKATPFVASEDIADPKGRYVIVVIFYPS